MYAAMSKSLFKEIRVSRSVKVKVELSKETPVLGAQVDVHWKHVMSFDDM